jgi:hypothetical protein
MGEGFSGKRRKIGKFSRKLKLVSQVSLYAKDLYKSPKYGKFKLTIPK